MRNSVFFRRVLLLIVIAILVGAALTNIIYRASAERIMIESIRTGFEAKAEQLAYYTIDRRMDLISEIRYRTLIETAPDLMDAYIIITVSPYHGAAPTILNLRPSTDMLDKELSFEEAAREISKEQSSIDAGRAVTFQAHIGEEKVSTLFVGYPIVVSYPPYSEHTVIGSVFIYKAMTEIRDSYRSLDIAVLLSSLITVVLMFFPVMFVVLRLIRPVYQVRNVAAGLSQGDFSLRADTRSRGEIGELAESVNRLASELDSTINALMLERSRLRQVLDGLSEGIIAIDDNFNLTHVNAGFIDLLGGEAALETPSPFAPADDSADDILPTVQSASGDPSTILLDEVDSHDRFYDLSLAADLLHHFGLLPHFRTVIETGEEVNGQIHRNDIILSYHITPLTTAGERIVGAVALFRDVTAEEQLERTRRDYVANVSHELRTPLTSVRGLVEPLVDGMVHSEDDRQRYYKIILQETMRLSRLITDMLDLSRLQTGQISVEKTYFSLRKMVGDIREKYTIPMREAGIEFITPDLPDDLPPAYGNLDRCEQLIIILVDNAVKFTPAGGSISLIVDPEGERYHITVRDTGAGIDPEDLPHIFERFYKADKSRTHSGTGLGLSIAHEIIRLSGEKITVTSKLNQGSSFTFTIAKEPAAKRSAGKHSIQAGNAE